MTSVAALDAARGLCALVAPMFPSIDIALLGCGNVGSAFAALARLQSPDRPVRITHALVRDCRRPRPTLHPDAERIDNGAAVFTTPPDVLVELLGGIEPARSLVLEALHRGIPVVTANKSLLAAHGAELREVQRPPCSTRQRSSRACRSSARSDGVRMPRTSRAWWASRTARATTS